MNCPLCNNKTSVYNRRENKRIYRQRRCNKCSHTFTTHEVNQFSILDALDDHLPTEVVDDVSKVLEIEFPEVGRKGETKFWEAK